MARRVLFVEDDRDVRDAISQSLDLAGYAITPARAYIEATDYITRTFDGVIVTDIRMQGKDGFDVLARVQKIDPDLPVIVLTGEGDVPMAVRAMAEGAYDFLEKPCSTVRLTDAIDRALEDSWALVLANRRLSVNGLAQTASDDLPLGQQMDMVEKVLIEQALARHCGRVARVAEALGLPRKTLYDKLKRHGLDPAVFRD